MSKLLRQIGLKAIVLLLRLLRRPTPAGWQRSHRPVELRCR
jgi:hypothetical protein